MSSRPKISEAGILERSRVAFENAKTQPAIAAVLNEFGYTPEKIAEGKSLLDIARAKYDMNKREDDETSAAYKAFNDKYESLEEVYSLHRKKAKVIFKNSLPLLEKLELTGSVPSAYIKWLEMVRKFYVEIQGDAALQTLMSRLKVTSDEISGAVTMIGELNLLRADYLREKGESQDATKQKDTAFSNLDDWMSEFFAVAKIALEDHPQLAEVLGKTIR